MTTLASGRLAATIVLVAVVAAPLAFAQNPKPKKKGTKPAPTATAAPEPTPEPPPPPPPPPPPEEDKTTVEETKPPPPPEKEWDISNTKEDPSQRYYFVGLRYRGDVIPQFLVNAFVDRGQTIYSNALGLELDSRKDGFSTVFALTYQNYYTGDMLFLQKGKPTTDNNYSVVNSALAAIYASVDVLWSLPVANHLDFEYGLGVGLGVVFGSLYDNWVSTTPNGPLYDATTNQHFTKCAAATPGSGTGCDPNAHTTPSPAKVGNYSESSGIAGPKPILFPMVNIPQLGFRYKPVKQFEARFGLGFSLTGFWFGISGDYGLEQKDEGAPATPHKASSGPMVHGML